jgi:hypothetical protein
VIRRGGIGHGSERRRHPDKGRATRVERERRRIRAIGSRGAFPLSWCNLQKELTGPGAVASQKREKQLLIVEEQARKRSDRAFQGKRSPHHDGKLRTSLAGWVGSYMSYPRTSEALDQYSLYYQEQKKKFIRLSPTGEFFADIWLT